MHGCCYAVWWVLAMVCFSLNTLQQNYNQLHSSYLHTNWGIIFTHVGHIMNGYSNYKHTYAIPIPDSHYKPIESLNCTKNHENIEANCLVINDMIAEINENYAIEFEELSQKLDITSGLT